MSKPRPTDRSRAGPWLRALMLTGVTMAGLASLAARRTCLSCRPGARRCPLAGRSGLTCGTRRTGRAGGVSRAATARRITLRARRASGGTPAGR